MITTIFYLIVIVSIIYFLFLVWLGRGQARLQEWSTGYTPSLNVLIVARNEEANIASLLESLKEQTYPQESYEITVVDDGSNDRTREILESYKERIKNLRFILLDEIPRDWVPKIWALNTAIERSDSDILLVTDADTKIGRKWIESIMKPFRDTSVGFVSAPALLKRETKNLAGEILFLESCAYESVSASSIGHGFPLTCQGNNLAFRRSAFSDAGGFEGIHHLIPGDDVFLMHKISRSGKWKLAYIADRSALVTSNPPIRMRTFIHQRLRFGSAATQSLKQDTGVRCKATILAVSIGNAASLVSTLFLITTLNPLWVIPITLKLMAEYFILLQYVAKIRESVRIFVYILSSIMYPVYWLIFGILGSYLAVTWRGRRFPRSQAPFTEM
ncbi:glycosyltransferase [Candidatus Neomarinimicrobiota bacterium]